MSNDLRLCFVMAASPTDGFFSQIAMFRLALNSLGGIYKAADIYLSLGDEKIVDIPERWRRHLAQGVIIHWADPSQFQTIGLRAQGDNKWKYDYKDYDLIIFCDADTILITPLDELLVTTKKMNGISGVIAHYPFPHEQGENLNVLWQSLSRQIIGKSIPLDYTYSLLDADEGNEHAKCPFYLNFGFVVMTPQVFYKIRTTYLKMRLDMAPLLKEPVFSGQIALTFAVFSHDVPVHAAEMKYNFPNDPVAEQLYSDQLKSISVIHYLRTNHFDRQKIFASEENFKDFLLLKLDGVNGIFQEFIGKLTDGHYPFN